MNSFIRYAEKKGASYIEINEAEVKQNNIEIQNKDVKEISYTNAKTYAIRLLYKGSFSLAYSAKPEFKKLIDQAIKSSKTLNKQNVKLEIDRCPKLKSKFKIKPKIDLEDVSLEQKKKDLLNFKLMKNVYLMHVRYADYKKFNHFINSEGRDLINEDSGISIIPFAYAKSGNKQENYYKPERGHCGYELMDKYPSATQEAMKSAIGLLNAIHAKGGKFTIIADPVLTGTFAHEAVGHSCEADLVLNNSSILGDKLGKKIASDIVNLSDDGTIDEWGYIPFDSEGIQSHNTPLIQNGILTGYMHNRETAAIFKTEPTGNGRAMSLATKPIVRMTNTVIHKGDSSFEEMVSTIKHGYYLREGAGGTVNTKMGEFIFNSKDGFLIENGQLTKRIKGVSLMGNILDILKNISLIGKTYGKSIGGFCGKLNQYVPVSERCPHIKIDSATVGGK